MVPAFLVEEHHEAFLVWQYAIEKSIIPKRENTLLHVDEHSDWATPRLAQSLDSLPQDLRAVADFTYNELDIGNFIWPAIYLGILSDVYWMRRRHTILDGNRRMFIRAANEASTEFITGIDSGHDARVCNLVLLTSEANPEIAGSVILDIDLDYFSSNLYPDKSGWCLEVTQDTYQDFVANRYHFLRLAPGSRVSAREDSGRYFLDFDRTAHEPQSEFTEEVQSELTLRITTFLAFLKRQKIEPKLILVCRSRYSGYTPKTHWSYIEQTLARGLKDLYGSELKAFDNVFQFESQSALKSGERSHEGMVAI